MAALLAGHDLWDIAIPTLAGIIGALAGGIPSYFLSRRASREVLERDQQARRDNEKSAAHRVFVKLSLLTNSLLGFQRQVEEMIAKADSDGRPEMALWQRLSAFAGIEREITPDFAPEELAFFVGAKQVDYVDDLILLPRRHRAAIDSLTTFARLKTELYYKLVDKGVTTRDGSGVSRTLSQLATNEANRVRVEADELELFTAAMRDQLRDFAAFAERVADRYGDLVRAYFDDPTMPRLARRDERDATGRGPDA